MDIEFSIERVGEDTTLKCDFTKSSLVPSVEDSEFTMAKIIEKMAQSHGITRVVFYQKREYEYDYQQTILLSEIAKIYKDLSKDEKLTLAYLSSGRCSVYADSWYNQLKNIIFNIMGN